MSLKECSILIKQTFTSEDVERERNVERQTDKQTVRQAEGPNTDRQPYLEASHVKYGSNICT